MKYREMSLIAQGEPFQDTSPSAVSPRDVQLSPFQAAVTLEAATNGKSSQAELLLAMSALEPLLRRSVTSLSSFRECPST